MKSLFVLPLGLSLFIVCQAAAQEATEGLELRGSFTAQSITSNQLSQKPQSGSPLVLGGKAVAYPTIKFSEHWFIIGAGQLNTRPFYYDQLATRGYGVKGYILQATLNYCRVSGHGSFAVRAGQMPSAFGSFLLRYDDTENPLVDVPLPYGYYYAPVSLLGVAGGQVDASRGRFDGRVQFANSSPANPRSIFAHDQYGNWAGGAGYTPRQGFRIGVSGFRGPYLDHKSAYYYPGELSPSKLPADAFGMDGNWAHGHTSAYVELQKFRMRYTLFPDFHESVAYGEFRQVLAPRWFVAGRYGYSTNSTGEQLHSIETGLAYRPNRYQLVKIAYEEREYASGRHSPDHTLGAQFITTFHRSFANRSIQSVA
jgi:hypothetical protein